MLFAYESYVYFYFKSEPFLSIKSSLRQHTSRCNELNEHLEQLKASFFEARVSERGQSELRDHSAFHMKRRRWREEIMSRHTHNCSATVCKNAHNQPLKYLCKYFNIQADEETLSGVEKVLNDFSAAEQGKHLLKDERERIVSGIAKSIPYVILWLERDKLFRKLGFEPIDLSDLYFPVYTFQYVSAGGNSSSRCDIKLDLSNLEMLIEYLNGLVKFRKSIAGQRALMTSALREKIKRRDDYTCKLCGLSAAQECNLLLEIDHVIPLAKGGITSEENLQTLCWKCNRSKGAKMPVSFVH